MFLSKCFNLFRMGSALLFVVASCFVIKLSNVSRLSAISGERCFFLLSASSQGVMQNSLSIIDLHKVRGESVTFEIKESEWGRYVMNEEVDDKIAQEILKKYQAEVRFIEEVSGVTSYYCYTPLWQDEIYLEGEWINLHIAVTSTRCSVGTPIIFGGF